MTFPLGYQLCGWEIIAFLSCLELNYFKCTIESAFRRSPEALHLQSNEYFSRLSDSFFLSMYSSFCSGILKSLDQGSNLVPWWKDGVLTTVPSGNSVVLIF